MGQATTRGRQILNMLANDIYLQYYWTADFNAKLSISHAYQLPFIDQSNYTPNITTQFGLDPETAWIHQLDSFYQSKKLKIHSSLYWMVIHNQIAYAGNRDNRFGYNINLPPTRTIGSLISVDYQMFPPFLISGSAALNHNTFTTGALFPSVPTTSPQYQQEQVVSGKTVPGAPLLTAEAHTTISLTSNLTLWLQEQYISNIYADGDFTHTLGRQAGYFLTNIRLGYQGRHWQFTFSINNLFSKFYYHYVSTEGIGGKFYYPANGISALFSVQYTM